MSDDYVLTSKFRPLTGAPRALLRGLLYALTLLGALWALEIHHSLSLAFFKEQYLALFLALGTREYLPRSKSADQRAW